MKGLSKTAARKAVAVNRRRVRVLSEGLRSHGSGPVLYWMSRDMRVDDNWALLYAQELALSIQQPLVVAFGLATTFPSATRRAHDFMLRGLIDVGNFSSCFLNFGR
jgi:deoxyribodipyrimidine photo-lyase